MEGARGGCGARLTPLIPEAMCRSRSGLHRSQGETEWLLDERQPGASWAGAGSCLGCVPLDVSHRPLAKWGFQELSLSVLTVAHASCYPALYSTSHEVSSHATLCITNGTLMFGVSYSIHLQQQLPLKG